MDEASDTPRSWGRWLLLGQAARFAVVGGYSSVRDWASTEPRDRAGLGSRCYGAGEEPVAGEVHRVVEERRSVRDGLPSPGQDRSRSGRVRTGPLRAGGRTRRNFAETVNVMNQKYPYLKNFKAGPWGLLTTWEYRCHFSRQWLQQLWPGSEHVSL